MNLQGKATIVLQEARDFHTNKNQFAAHGLQLVSSQCASSTNFSSSFTFV